MKKILIATKNEHKVKEFNEMLFPIGYEVISLNDIDKDIEIEENGSTFEENAYIKAKTVYDALHIPVVSDDSGFCIKHFDWKPGIYSARFLQDHDYEYKNNYLLDKMKDVTDRTCKYVCVICVVDDYGAKYYRGECLGRVSDKIIGNNGFGYDPIFYYPEYKTTLANVSDEQKNAISHRHIALEKMLEDLKND